MHYQATAGALAQVLAPAGKGMNDRSGIYNQTNAGEKSWYGFAKELLMRANATMGRPLQELVPTPTSRFPRPAPHPMNSHLNIDKLATTFGMRLPTWQDGLALICERLACA